MEENGWRAGDTSLANRAMFLPNCAKVSPCFVHTLTIMNYECKTEQNQAKRDFLSAVRSPGPPQKFNTWG